MIYTPLDDYEVFTQYHLSGILQHTACVCVLLIGEMQNENNGANGSL